MASVRPARTEEDLARAESFLRTPRVREVVEAHPEERGCVRICEADGELLGALLIDPAALRIRDVDVRCARLHETGGEDGRSRFRKTGESDLFEFLMEEFLGYVWARRYPIAYVHGELALFPEHGFVPCFYHPRTYVDVAAALKLPAEYRVRHFKADDVKRIDELRSRHRRSKPTVFASGVPMFHHFCIESPDRRIRGCFSLEVNPDARWNPRFFSPEVDASDHAAACTLLRHCAEKAAELDIKRIHFPLGAGHPISRLCLELGGEAVVKACASDPRLNEEMIHIADPARLVAALEPYFVQRVRQLPYGTRASIPIATEQGQWSLEVEDDKVRLDGLTQKPDDCVELADWKWTQLLTGYRSVEELDAEMTPEQASILEALFPRTWPYSMPDADHWSTRIPPMPYTKEALTVVEQVRLPWCATPHDESMQPAH